MTTITEQPGFQRLRAVAMKGALKVHIATNGQMRVNRAYTPTAVLKATGEITGKRYKRGQQQIALDDLMKWLEENQ